MPVSTWSCTLACAVAVLAPLALAQPPSLALPVAGTTPATDVRDAPDPLTESIDVADVEDAAVAQADRLPPETWELEALALELAFDLPAIHALVRDHIAFDPYPGVLRGARGTLAARAGNAWDQALLLRELAEASDYDVRFAFGTLDEDAATELLEAALAGPRVPLDDPPISELLPIDVARLRDRAQRDHALLIEALGDRPLGGEAESDRTAAVRDHVWVQALDEGGVWRDLDPAAAFGEARTDATTTAPSLPPDAWHAVVVRAIAETLDAGVLIESVVLEERFVASEAAASEVWFYLQPDGAGVGGTVVELLDGSAWLPVLLVDGVARVGTAFELGGDGGGGVLGNLFGDSGPELVALSLELETTGPGLTPATVRRVLLDRAPATERLAGTIDAAALEPWPEGRSPTAFGGLHHVLASTGGASPRAHAIARAYAAHFAATELRAEDAATSYALDDLMLPLAVADRTLVLASERAVVDGLAAEGVRAFVGRPRVYLTSLLPYPEVPNGTARVIDLALDDVAIAAPTDAPAGTAARHRLWYGVLQTALETELTLQAARALDPTTATVDSVSLAMPGAALRVVTTEDPPSAPGPALRRALDDGHLAVLVGDAARFWTVDPESGATRSVFEPGVRIGFTGGGNGVNASFGGQSRMVVDPRTGNVIGHVQNNTYYRYSGKPPSRCSGGTEYVILLGCVSLPASMTVGIATGVVVTAVVAWSIVLLEVIFL